MRNLKEIGSRVKEARTSRGLKQSDLAAKIKKSKQTVSSIERGDVEMTISVLRDVTDALRIDVQWILLGISSTSGGDAVGPEAQRGLALRPLPSGRAVPHLDRGQILSFVEGRFHLDQATKLVYTPFDVGAKAFSFDVVDASMAPEFLEGEVVTVDPDRPITPGVVVAAVVYKANGVALREPMLVLREFRAKSISPEQAPYDLVPASKNWPMISIEKEMDCVIFGVFVAASRGARRQFET